MTKPLAQYRCNQNCGAIELHRVNPLGAYAFRGMQWTLHRAGLVEAEVDVEVVVGEQLVMAYLQIGVVEWRISSSTYKAQREPLHRSTRET
jgi:hypothetical protein